LFVRRSTILRGRSPRLPATETGQKLTNVVHRSALDVGKGFDC
jgi:hypothetical protein